MRHINGHRLCPAKQEARESHHQHGQQNGAKPVDVTNWIQSNPAKSTSGAIAKFIGNPTVCCLVQGHCKNQWQHNRRHFLNERKTFH